MPFGFIGGLAVTCLHMDSGGGGETEVSQPADVPHCLCGDIAERKTSLRRTTMGTLLVRKHLLL